MMNKSRIPSKKHGPIRVLSEYLRCNGGSGRLNRLEYIPSVRNYADADDKQGTKATLVARSVTNVPVDESQARSAVCLHNDRGRPLCSTTIPSLN